MPIAGGLPGSPGFAWVTDAISDAWLNGWDDSGVPIHTEAQHFDPLAIVRGGNAVSPFEYQQPDLPINSPLALESADSQIPAGLKAQYDLIGNWFTQLFKTQESAAVEQARRNEESAVAAWRRSEQAADNALKRARELRQTEKQDLVASLKAAGLNPVLAAGSFGGTSNTAPQATAPASSSSSSGGVNGADLLQAIAAILSGSGNLMKGISSFLPSSVISFLGGAL